MVGCSKNSDNDDLGDDNNKCHVTNLNWQSTEYNEYEIYDFEYDSQNRITSIKKVVKESDDIFTQNCTLSYSNNEITVKDSYGTQTDTYRYFLNDKGLITYVLSDDEKVTFEYNSENYLTTISEGNDKTILTYEGGNLVKHTGYYESTNQYDLTKSRVSFIEVMKYNILPEELIESYTTVLYEQGYFGKKSKNRVVGYAHGEQLVYEEDAKGNIIKAGGFAITTLGCN